MSGGSLLVRGGRLMDPSTGRDEVADLLLEDGRIRSVGPDLPAPDAVEVFDATGLVVCPGFVDIHTHLREPGHEYKETIETGCRAAAWGGFTAVCAMPNTNPVNDNEQVTDYILNRAAEANSARVYPVGAISKGLEGRQLCEFEELKARGAIAVSDDGNPLMDDRLMRTAMEVAESCGLFVISHCENLKLNAGGVMNAGPVAGIGSGPSMSTTRVPSAERTCRSPIGSRIVAFISS